MIHRCAARVVAGSGRQAITVVTSSQHVVWLIAGEVLDGRNYTAKKKDVVRMRSGD